MQQLAQNAKSQQHAACCGTASLQALQRAPGARGEQLRMHDVCLQLLHLQDKSVGDRKATQDPAMTAQGSARILHDTTVAEFYSYILRRPPEEATTASNMIYTRDAQCQQSTSTHQH
jgi:hypothetical protein